jgi:hypothetical protein|tara:strand:- start:1426 stop:1710 length:285 start_codon:yes stop_codon:yes gene_type:complete
MSEQLHFNGIYNQDDGDEVNSPFHYRQGNIECIEAMKAMLGDGFEYYLQGAILKYLWRYHYKGKPEQDLQKAHWYLELLQETVRSNNVNSNGKG